MGTSKSVSIKFVSAVELGER